MKLFKKLVLTAILASVQLFIGQNTDTADAHCPWNDLPHCASHADPSPIIPGTAKVAEEVWGEAGRGLYISAAKFMERDNTLPFSLLDNRQKTLLRPEFGSLVDRVRIKYGADMLDRWGSGNFQISQGSDGQTFCNVIYIKNAYRKGDDYQVILLGHELQHSRQCEELGGMSNFGYHYFKQFKKAGQSYENNLLERQANEVESRVKNFVLAASSPSTAYFNYGGAVRWYRRSAGGYCGITSPTHLKVLQTTDPAPSLGDRSPSEFGRDFGVCPPYAFYFNYAGAVRHFSSNRRGYCAFTSPDHLRRFQQSNPAISLGNQTLRTDFGRDTGVCP